MDPKCPAKWAAFRKTRTVEVENLAEQADEIFGTMLRPCEAIDALENVEGIPQLGLIFAIRFGEFTPVYKDMVSVRISPEELGLLFGTIDDMIVQPVKVIADTGRTAGVLVHNWSGGEAYPPLSGSFQIVTSCHYRR